MMDVDQIRDIVGIVGNVMSFGLFLSPLPTFITIWRGKSVGQFSPIPYLATLLNCIMWFLYGLPIVHPNSILVLTINGTGVFFEIAYIVVFLVYSGEQLQLKVAKILLAEVAFVAVVATVVFTTAHTHERRSLVFGVLCVIFGTCMYASPLSIMKLVIQTRSVRYMPFTVSLVGFLNGVCWTTYALLRFDIFITIPNGLGTLLGLMQLILYAIYYRTTQWDDAEL